MRWIQFTLGALAACGMGLGYVWLRGGQLPESHRTQLTFRFDAPIERVWAVLSDFEGQPAWRSGLTGVNQAAPGLWVEDYQGTLMAMQTTALESPHLLERRIADPDQPFQGFWRYQLSADGEGTLLTLSEEASIHNPLYRFLAHGMSDFEQTLRGLVADLEGPLGPAVEVTAP
ncbi:MAG: SRPBCC family protein [bacterium]|nr:SRPBCC family protein [bacterium]